MPGPHGPRKRTLSPGKRPKAPHVARAGLRKKAKAETVTEIPEIEHLPEGSTPPTADCAVSAPVVTGGPTMGALPRSKPKTPAHIKAAVERAFATSEGKEPPPIDETGVDPALKREFGEAAKAKMGKLEAAEAAAAEPRSGPRSEGGADVYDLPKETKRPGPELLYEPGYDEIARQYVANGATDHELAELFGVSHRSIVRWKSQFVSFRAAIALGRKENLAAQIENVENSLYNRAVGYTQVTEKVMQFKGQVMRVPMLEYVPGDVAAQKHWLANRDPERWRVDPDKGQDQNATQKALEAMALLELARRMGQVLIGAAQVEETIALEAVDAA